jgi:hypothetical protein
MNADEVRIIGFLNEFPDEFVSVIDVSRKLGKGRRYKDDRTWALPIMRRMEMDGLLETNDAGDFRVRTEYRDNGKDQVKDQIKDQAKGSKGSKGTKASETKSIDFKQALKTPGVSLGDTTIIRISDVQEQGTASRNQSTR